jgi:tyrosyl-tRNA synthetase
VAEQIEYLTATVEHVVPEAELAERLALGRPLRVKLGVDPTAPDVHLGWAVVFDLLRRFQDMGHVAVLIMGDFTAQVGDPSGKSETRRRLAAGEVAGYAESCLEMLRPLLADERLEVRYNSEWLAAMDMADVLDLTSRVTVARILEREDFAKRLNAGEPVSMIEMMYPLLQGMDSVAVEADIELGGTDQLWNLLVGRDLQTRFGQQPQLAMTVPLLVGTDGTRKMSQSYDNYVSIRDDAASMFGKVMSIPDEAMPLWFRLASGLPATEVGAVVDGLEDGSEHPGRAKRRLATAIVDRYWGSGSGAAAEQAFDQVFVHKEAPDEILEVPLPEGEAPVWLPGALKEAGLVASTSEARRLLAQGAVRLDGERVEGEELPGSQLAGRVVKVGKRRFVRFVESA